MRCSLPLSSSSQSPPPSPLVRVGGSAGPARRLRSAWTAGGVCLLLVRLLLGVGFHLFHIIFLTAVRTRFGLDATGYAAYMAVVGLAYAVSQRAAPAVLRRLGARPALLTAVAVMGAGRVGAVLASSLGAVYVATVSSMVALGVANVVIATECSLVAPAHELGGLLGLVEAAEKFSGLVGPSLGAVLGDANATTVAVRQPPPQPPQPRKV